MMGQYTQPTKPRLTEPCYLSNYATHDLIPSKCRKVSLEKPTFWSCFLYSSCGFLTFSHYAQPCNINMCGTCGRPPANVITEHRVGEQLFSAFKVLHSGWPQLLVIYYVGRKPFLVFLVVQLGWVKNLYADEEVFCRLRAQLALFPTAVHVAP